MSSSRPRSATAAPHSIPEPIVDEHALIRRVRSGDVAAFDQLFLTYYRALCAHVADYVESRAIAEEVVQELFADLWIQRHDWRVRVSLRSYLFGAARNRAYNCIRHAHVVARWEARAVHDTCDNGMSRTSYAADNEARRQELVAALTHATQRLPRRQREAFRLRWQGDLSHAEIADAMRLSVKGVEKLLGKAFRTLREDLAAFW